MGLELHEWIAAFPVNCRKAERERLAAICGVTEPALRHWANGTRQVPGPKCTLIEFATWGQVPVHRLRADIFPAPMASEAA